MTARLASVVHGLRRAASEGSSDTEFLQAFLRAGDERAFAALVERHGPMVLGVAQRILGNVHDAEDVFQATFIVLARRAASVRPASMVGNWLYGVAHRTALDARRAIARRRAKERTAVPRHEPDPPDRADLAIVDQELACLPDKLRVALVLCELEGRSRRAVAEELGIAEGTVASRVARGRALLAKRLTRQGFACAAASPLASWSHAMVARLPSSLVHTTVEAALGKAAVAGSVTTLVAGVLRAMLLNKLKHVFGVILVFALAVSAVGLMPEAPDASGQGKVAKQTAGEKSAAEVPKGALRIHVVLGEINAANLTLTAMDVTGAPSADELLATVLGDSRPAPLHAAQLAEELIATRPQTHLVGVPVAKQAEIQCGGKESLLTDLKPGMRADLDLNVGPRGLQVVRIHTDGKVQQRRHGPEFYKDKKGDYGFEYGKDKK
jgi:RNA polymerase sigma factor (sigma-70 family)